MTDIRDRAAKAAREYGELRRSSSGVLYSSEVVPAYNAGYLAGHAAGHAVPEPAVDWTTEPPQIEGHYWTKWSDRPLKKPTPSYISGPGYTPDSYTLWWPVRIPEPPKKNGGEGA
jgi:hypothetical protein